MTRANDRSAGDGPRAHPFATRRAFLGLCTMLGVGLATNRSISTGAEAVRHDRHRHRLSETRLAMGTLVGITALDRSKLRARAAVSAAFEEVERLSRLLNRFDPSSAVGELNRQGWLDDAPPELEHVVGRALDHFQLSRGVFDISIQPVVDLLRTCHAEGRSLPPPAAALREALAHVGARDIVPDRRRLRFTRPGMGITLDGIAKGYVADRASAVLSRHGVRDHLVDAGGDIRTRGLARDQHPWRVAVRDPHKAGDRPSVVRLTDGAIATSGSYEIYYDREKLFHHIASPTTGLCPSALTSVSILAETAMDADALSTTAFLLDPAAAIQFIDSLPGCEALALLADNTPLLSRGWPSARL